jgi:hypothetical protein
MGSGPVLRLRGMAGLPTPARRAVVALVRDGECVEVGPVAATTCDAALVDDLLRFDLAARRLGWQLRLRQVDQQLRELLDLVGVADRVDP